MSTGYSWEGIRQVRATLLGARHVSERLCGGRVYLGRYIKCSTFLPSTFNRQVQLWHVQSTNQIMLKALDIVAQVQFYITI